MANIMSLIGQVLGEGVTGASLLGGVLGGAVFIFFVTVLLLI